MIQKIKGAPRERKTGNKNQQKSDTLEALDFLKILNLYILCNYISK